MTITFSVPGEPCPKGRPRSVVRARKDGSFYAGTYTPEKTRRAEDLFAARCMEHRPPMPFAGPLRVELLFVFSVPASFPRWQREAALRGDFHHTSARGDVDNFAKLALDSMNAVFFNDDRQIVELHATKRYGEVPMTVVTIDELPQAVRQRTAATQSLFTSVG